MLTGLLGLAGPSRDGEPPSIRYCRSLALRITPHASWVIALTDWPRICLFTAAWTRSLVCASAVGCGVR